VRVNVRTMRISGPSCLWKVDVESISNVMRDVIVRMSSSLACVIAKALSSSYREARRINVLKLFRLIVY
jgi:hypothetical protein